ncbi:hypothetical protein [Ferrimonas balearica]|uniref:hypothetical protein n=1 Tax=Ferrimonas balearica TaxID=44012 RepID=UPI001C98E4E8|nr:hypothetical protein [Ferrimonas balearica]MBY5992054.1 hypothetical protein [Ferrimonas balearica]
MKLITGLLVLALAGMLCWHGSALWAVFQAAQAIQRVEEPDSSLAERYLLLGDWPVGLEAPAETPAFYIQGEPADLEHPGGANVGG